MRTRLVFRGGALWLATLLYGCFDATIVDREGTVGGGGAGGSGGGTTAAVSTSGATSATTTSVTTTTTGPTTATSTGAGTGGGGGAAACQKCAEAITPPNGDPTKLCSGASTMDFDALAACACTGSCKASCGDNKCMGMMASMPCNNCMGAADPAGCQTEYNACANDL